MTRFYALSLVAGTLLFLASCADSDPGEPQVGTTKREYVVVTKVTLTYSSGGTHTETYTYDAQSRLQQVVFVPQVDDTLRGVSPLRFTYTEDGSPETVTMSYRTFSDMVDPTDGLFQWERHMVVSHGLVMGFDDVRRMTLQVLFRDPVIQETRTRTVLVREGNRIVGRTDTNEDGDLTSQTTWQYDGLGHVTELRTRVEEPDLAEFLEYETDDRGRLVQVTAERPYMSQVGLQRIVQEYSYGDGIGTLRQTSYSRERDGSLSTSNHVWTFEFEWVENPGSMAFVLSPTKGLDVLSPFFVHSGMSCFTATLCAPF